VWEEVEQKGVSETPSERGPRDRDNDSQSPRSTSTSPLAIGPAWASSSSVSRPSEASERRAGAVLASVRRLPDLAPLRRDLMQAGRALGSAAVNALSARAARIFTETTRLLGRAFGHDHDRGRGDDGLGLGR